MYIFIFIYVYVVYINIQKGRFALEKTESVFLDGRTSAGALGLSLYRSTTCIVSDNTQEWNTIRPQQVLLDQHRVPAGKHTTIHNDQGTSLCYAKATKFVCDLISPLDSDEETEQVCPLKQMQSIWAGAKCGVIQMHLGIFAAVFISPPGIFRCVTEWNDSRTPPLWQVWLPFLTHTGDAAVRTATVNIPPVFA